MIAVGFRPLGSANCHGKSPTLSLGDDLRWALSAMHSFLIAALGTIAVLLALILASGLKADLTGIATLCLAIATAVLAMFAFLQLKDIQADRRPWLYFKSGSVASNINFDDDEVWFIFDYELTNTGRSPATEATATFSMIPYGFDVTAMDGVGPQRQECNERQSMFRSSVFPNQIQVGHFRVKMPRKEFDAKIAPGTEVFAIWIVGCIRYRVPGNAERFFTSVLIGAAPKVKAINPLGRGTIAAADFNLSPLPISVSE